MVVVVVVNIVVAEMVAVVEVYHTETILPLFPVFLTLLLQGLAVVLMLAVLLTEKVETLTSVLLHIFMQMLVAATTLEQKVARLAVKVTQKTVEAVADLAVTHTTQGIIPAAVAVRLVMLVKAVALVVLELALILTVGLVSMVAAVAAVVRTTPATAVGSEPAEVAGVAVLV